MRPVCITDTGRISLGEMEISLQLKEENTLRFLNKSIAQRKTSVKRIFFMEYMKFCLGKVSRCDTKVYFLTRLTMAVTTRIAAGTRSRQFKIIACTPLCKISGSDRVVYIVAQYNAFVKRMFFIQMMKNCLHKIQRCDTIDAEVIL